MKITCHWYFNVPPIKFVQNKGKLGIPDVGKDVCGVVVSIMTSKDIYILIPGVFECYLIAQKGCYRCDSVKDFEMGD